MVLVVLAAVVVFVMQNIAVVEIQFLFWSMSITRSLLLFIIFGVGVLLGWVLKSFAQRQKKKNGT